MTEHSPSEVFDGGKILIAGGGFIGSRLPAPGLVPLGSIRIVNRTSSAVLERVASLGIDVVIGDLRDAGVVKQAVEGVSRIVVATGGLTPRMAEANPQLNEQLTLEPLRSLFGAALKKELVSLTLISSGGTVYGSGCRLPTSEDHELTPIGQYGVTKLKAEQLALEFGERTSTAVRIARVSNAYGPCQDSSKGQGIIGVALDCARRGFPLTIQGDGRISRDFVFINDVARAISELALLPGAPTVVNIGGGATTSILEVVDAIREVTGRSLEVEFVQGQRHDVSHSWLDISLLQSMITFKPLSLHEGIRLAWLEAAIEPREYSDESVDSIG